MQQNKTLSRQMHGQGEGSRCMSFVGQEGVLHIAVLCVASAVCTSACVCVEDHTNAEGMFRSLQVYL